MIEIISLVCVIILLALFFIIGKKVGVEEGIAMAQDMAMENEAAEEEERMTKSEVISSVMNAVDSVIVIPQTLRDNIVVKLYEDLKI